VHLTDLKLSVNQQDKIILAIVMRGADNFKIGQDYV